MSKLVTFLLSLFVNAIPDWKIKKKKFKKSPKLNHSLITEMLDIVYKSELVQNDTEIDHQASKDSKIVPRLKRSLFRFLDQEQQSLVLSFPIKTKRRSRSSLEPIVEPRAPKQTRLQSGKCSSLNCEWKVKYHEEKVKNDNLQNEIENLTQKLEKWNSQSSHDKSSQFSSNPYSQSSIPLLQTEQCGSVKKYSIEMYGLAIILIVSCNLSGEIIPTVLSSILAAAQLRHLDIPTTSYFLKIRSMLQPLNEKLIRSFCSSAESITICFDESSFKTRKGQVLAVSVMNQAAEQKIVALVEHNERSDSIGKYAIDVKIILESLRDALGSCFTSTMLKTNMILSDNCPSAQKTRTALKKELDEKFPVEGGYLTALVGHDVTCAACMNT